MMELYESATGKKLTQEIKEKNLNQRRLVSEPTVSSEISSFAGRVQYEDASGKDSSAVSHMERCSPGTPPSPSISHSSHDSEIHQPSPRAFLRHSPHLYSQPPAQETFPVGIKPQLQTGMDTQGRAIAGQPQSRTSDDMFQGNPLGRGSVLPCRKSPSFSLSRHSQSVKEQLEDTPKKEQRPKKKKPGKYVCHYCGRACAKPSVLRKHIRSHTGERPYPCDPCGFSFKTKSNLYKHRKSQTHAIKAGLVPFSESTRVDTDETSPLGEGEVHSDGEQSTDTDEDTSRVSTLFGKSSHPPFEVDRSTTVKNVTEKSLGAEFSGDGASGSAYLPLLIVPKQGILVPAMQCSTLTEIEASPVSPQEGCGEECHTVKQRLALRLHEKKVQDSESSFSLLSPHSKGSTESGYFSRSESAEQEVSPPITNAKSYQEIMFGKCYRPSPGPLQSITVGMATTPHKDINVAGITGEPGVMQTLAVSEISSDHISHCYAKDKNIVDSVNLHANIFLRGNLIGTQRMEGFSQKQHPSKHCQVNTVPEVPSDTGLLIRSSSLPTSSSNLDIPLGLQESQSFDERTMDDVFHPGSGGLRRLRRQAAFELFTCEGHTESDTQGTILKTTVLLSGAAKLGSHSPLVPELKGYSSCSTKVGVDGFPEFQQQLMHQRQAMESATRKRRKEKSSGDDDDSPTHCSSDHSSSIEILGSSDDYDSKLQNQDPLGTLPTGKGHILTVCRQLDSIDIGTRMSLEDTMLIQDPDRKATGNVISVIQHTNSLSRPSSFEKSDSVDHSCNQQSKPSSFYYEQPDSENTEESHSISPVPWSGSMEQQPSDSKTVHTPHRLIRQSNIQVPEIRVTVESEKPETSAEVPVKEPKKHVEEFQWPQRSESLSQLPVEKLPPKKKRLRLIEIERFSRESSFESTCTSLSRSPSEESNLSHTSSLSLSLDREESSKSASPMKQGDLGKQAEFLTVPGLTQRQQREMRRSSSEQVPCSLPLEIPEIRSRSFDYGSLSSSSRQGEIYASASSMKERRRGYLVRQAPLSAHPESVVLDKLLDAKQEQSEQLLNSLHRQHPAWQSAPLPSLSTDCDVLVADVTRCMGTIHPVLSLQNHPLQLSVYDDKQLEGHLVIQKLSHSSGQQPSGTDNAKYEVPSEKVAWHPSLHSSIAQPQSLPFQPGILWHRELTKRHMQHTPLHALQLQKIQITTPGVLESPQKPLHSPQLPQIQIVSFGSDQSYWSTPKTSPYQVSDLSGALSMSPLVVPQSQASLPGIVVPVRAQTNVPSYGSLMYTSVSQMLVTVALGGTSSGLVMCNVSDGFQNTLPDPGISLSPILAEPEGSLHNHYKVQEPMPIHINTGIPLSLTCGTISTTDASSTGGNKRVLSPASSRELFSEIKQQKRVKEERMYGQIVEELSAVELGNSGTANDGGELQKPCPPKDNISSKLFSLYTDETSRSASSCLMPPRPMLLDSPEGRGSQEKLEVDEQTRKEGQCSTLNANDAEEVKLVNNDKVPETMQIEHPSEGSNAAGGSFFRTILPQDSQYLRLRTSTSVSWCFLNYTKPNNAQTVSLSSVYASWSVSPYNPNPPSMSTKAALALLCSKQRKYTTIYTMAALYQPKMGKPSSSYFFCKQKSDQGKPELMQLNVIKTKKKTKEVSCREKVDHREKEVSKKQAEATRIKIFEGGYRSNEDYIYVRGRGRGKYICEECGIRCKKPSMLRKHIRSHTDVRPYGCKFCNFAFKTKGNLTKHVKSKAHMKKCLELGVPVTSVMDAEVEEPDNADYEQKDSGKVLGVEAEHQFSDVDDSEGPEDDGDEIEEDDDDDDEYEGDSTPRTRSRSASPHVITITSLPTSWDPVTEFPGSVSKPPLFSYFLTLPGNQIKQPAGDSCSSESQVHLQPAHSNKENGKNLAIQSSLEEDTSPPSFDTPLSHLLSSGCFSSSTRESSSPSRQYLSPKRDLSPQGGPSHQCEALPLLHIAPKKPGLSSRAHLSPAPPGRPLSPGKYITSKWESSSGSHHRGMIRTVSPRRSSHHHSAPWDPGQYLLPKAGHVNQDKRKSPSQGMWLSGEVAGGQHSSTVAQRGLFSHLPLHSQQQVRTPLLMIPIGGIQVVRSAATPAQPVLLPLRRGQVEDTAPDDGPSRLQEGGTSAEATDRASTSQEKLFSCGTYSSPQDQSFDVGDKDCRQDDRSVQTCTRAIESLKIASEEAFEKAAETVDLHPPSPHNRISSEDMQFRTLSIISSEHDSSQAGISAPPPEPLGSEKDKFGTPETSLGPNTFHCESSSERQSAPQGLSKMPKSTETGKDYLKETMEYR